MAPKADAEAIGAELRALKEKLKGEGLTGKKLNEHPEVKALVEALNAAKSGSGDAKAASPKASPKAAPNAAKSGSGDAKAASPKASPKAAPKAEPKAKAEKAPKEAKKAMSTKNPEKDDGKKVQIHLEPPSGTRDFFPAEMRQQRYLFDKFREVANLYGFSEYDAPVLEHEELYKRKAGEEITEQMYNFVDKDEAAVTLRPEMTPSLARMVLNLMRAETGQMSVQLPLKWYSIPQCWRYETTQRGRKREHYQWNMDIVGMPGIHAEVELLSAICTFFERVGITSKDVGLKVNSRKVLGAMCKNAGVADDRFAETCVIIDKLDKIGACAVKQELTEKVGLPDEVGEKITKAMAAKDLDEFAAIAGVTGSAEVTELKTLFELAADYGFGDFLQFDASVVRGLAYYTGVVFEGFDKAGVLRAICGGGRYDRLLSLYGSPKEIPCVGFGFGDCVLDELLKEKKVKPDLPEKVDYVVAPYNHDFMGKAMHVARQLRLAGKSVDLFPEPAKKVAKAFNYADRVGAVRIAFVAPGEWERGTVTVKDLRSFGKDVPDDQKQKEVPLNDLANVDAYFGQGGGATAKSVPEAVCAASAPKASAAAAPPAGAGASEAALLDYPYVGGFSPSKADRDLYDKLATSTGRPDTPAMARWFDHVSSFSEFERTQWP